MRDDYCEFRFASEMARVRQIVNSVLAFAKRCPHQNPQCLSDEEQGDLKLVLSELLYNAVVHGNGCNSQKYVQVQVSLLSDDTVQVCIQDEGPGFNHRQVLAQAAAPEALFNENGRGMLLVQALTDELRFNETGNQVRFVKRLAFAAQKPKDAEF